jgi:hypothetical protein
MYVRSSDRPWVYYDEYTVAPLANVLCEVVALIARVRPFNPTDIRLKDPRVVRGGGPGHEFPNFLEASMAEFSMESLSSPLMHLGFNEFEGSWGAIEDSRQWERENTNTVGRNYPTIRLVLCAVARGEFGLADVVCVKG